MRGGGWPPAAAVATGDFGFKVKPKMKNKPASTEAPTLADTAAGTYAQKVADVSVQTITVKATPPGTKKALPPFKPPPPSEPPPPQPAKFGVGAKASTGGLSEAIARTPSMAFTSEF